MASWQIKLFKNALKFSNKTVEMRIIQEDDFDILCQLAIKDPTIWTYNPNFYCDSQEQFKKYFDAGITQLKQQNRIPFIIYAKTEDNKLVPTGQSSLYNFEETHKKLTIGYSWFTKDFQKQGINLNSKYLLMKFAFEELGTKRVDFYINKLNEPSRRSVEKYGAKLDGILRRHMKTYNGTWRDTAVYSILDDEWPEIKKQKFQNYD